MASEIIGLLGLGLMFVLIAFHVPIGVSMGLSGFVTFGLLRNFTAAVSLFGTETIDKLSSMDLAIVPLFLLMGGFATVAGLSSDLYRIANAFVGHVRGGLAMATIGGCAGMGAICGSSLATTATMTRVSLDEMLERRYAPTLATGSIAAGGTLGILIPPSIIFVLYAVLTEQFVLTLFVAALLPALVAITLHGIAVRIYVLIHPEAGPAGERAGFRERIRSVGDGWAALGLMTVVTGGIYAGIFSVTESAAVGAALSFLIALGRKRLSLREFWGVLSETAATTSMIYMIVIGASIFTYAVTLSQLPEWLVSSISASGLPPLVIIFLLLVMYLVLGSIFDTISSMIITLPFVFPLILHLGYDPIWWGVINVMVIEIGMITPPIGMNVFVMKAMVPHIELRTIFRGIMPFLAADIVRLVILTLFPIIALWLPNVLHLAR